jgi:hypothetical protein
MTLRHVGLYGGRIPCEHLAMAVPADYRSTAIDIDELREAARAEARQEEEAVELADEAALQHRYVEAKAEAVELAQRCRPLADLPSADQQEILDAFAAMTDNQLFVWGRRLRWSLDHPQAWTDAWRQIHGERVARSRQQQEPDEATF